MRNFVPGRASDGQLAPARRGVDPERGKTGPGGNAGGGTGTSRATRVA